MTHPESQAELLPCPFCGSNGMIKRGKTIMVSCTKCTASTFQYLNDRVSAIEAWNRRAAQSPVAAAPVLTEDEIREHGKKLQGFKNYAFRAGKDQGMTGPEQDEYDDLIAFARAIESRSVPGAVSPITTGAMQQMADAGFTIGYAGHESVVAQPKIPFAVTWHCELADCLCHRHAANVRAKCVNFIAAAPQSPEAS